MLNELREEMNLTLTENGALAYKSTHSACLDFFSVAGALRYADCKRAKDLFTRAYAENGDYALRTLFYARDIRGGLGERSLFRDLVRYSAIKFPESIEKNIAYIPFYGRYDDCLSLLNTPCEAAVVEMLKKQLEKDVNAMEAGEGVSLLGKWLPSINASSDKTRATAQKLCRLMHISNKDYRKTLSSLRSYIDILETRLTQRDYTFDYEKLPAKALYLHRNAFQNNDAERYLAFMDNVNKGMARLNAGTIYPYEVIRNCTDTTSEAERMILDTTWKNLPDYTDGSNSIAVVDGSGSMYCDEINNIRPIDVAVSLGIYFAEHNTGVFHNCFITFSSNPRLVTIKGKDIYRKASYCMSYNEIENTNLERVFLLIYAAAVKNNLPQSEMPKTIYIISDMEFDEGCCRNEDTIFHKMKKLFEKSGYKLPTVVYWNVCSRNEQSPVTQNEAGAVLVSGCSPSVFAHALNPDITPYEYMQSVLESERYRCIGA